MGELYKYMFYEYTDENKYGKLCMLLNEQFKLLDRVTGAV